MKVYSGHTTIEEEVALSLTRLNTMVVCFLKSNTTEWTQETENAKL